MKWTAALSQGFKGPSAKELFFSRLVEMDVNDPDTGGLCKAQLEFIRDSLELFGEGHMEKTGEWKRDVATFLLPAYEGKREARCKGIAICRPSLSIDIYGTRAFKDIRSIEFEIATDNNADVPDEMPKDLATAAGLKDGGENGSLLLRLGMASPTGCFHPFRSSCAGQHDSPFSSGILFHKNDIAILMATTQEALSVLEKKTAHARDDAASNRNPNNKGRQPG